MKGASDRRICDGSDEVRLAVRVMAKPGRVRAYNQPLYELGTSFLYVDGRCHYWVQAPAVDDSYALWRGYREGVLSEEQEGRLHDLASYNDVSRGIRCEGALATDGSPLAVWDGRGERYCNGQADVEIDWPMRTELYELGTELSGPMRIEVGQDAVPPDKAVVYDWPLAASPEAYEISYGDALSGFGRSKLVSDPADTAALRALRDRFLSGVLATPGYYFGVVYVTPRGYAMSMRDHLPFTHAEDGLWSPL